MDFNRGPNPYPKYRNGQPIPDNVGMGNRNWNQDHRGGKVSRNNANYEPIGSRPGYRDQFGDSRAQGRRQQNYNSPTNKKAVNGQSSYNFGHDRSPNRRRNRSHRNNQKNTKAKKGTPHLIVDKAQENPARCLFIRNIEFGTPEAEILDLFLPFGDVKTNVYHFEKGVLYITYYDIRAAINAKSSMDGYVFKSKEIDAHFSFPKSTSDFNQPPDESDNQGTIKVAFDPKEGIPSDEELFNYFSQYGEVEEVNTYDPISIKIVSFYDSRAALEVRERPNWEQLDSLPIAFDLSWDANCMTFIKGRSSKSQKGFYRKSQNQSNIQGSGGYMEQGNYPNQSNYPVDTYQPQYMHQPSHLNNETYGSYYQDANYYQQQGQVHENQPYNYNQGQPSYIAPSYTQYGVYQQNIHPVEPKFNKVGVYSPEASLPKYQNKKPQTKPQNYLPYVNELELEKSLSPASAPLSHNPNKPYQPINGHSFPPASSDGMIKQNTIIFNKENGVIGINEVKEGPKVEVKEETKIEAKEESVEEDDTRAPNITSLLDLLAKAATPQIDFQENNVKEENEVEKESK